MEAEIPPFAIEAERSVLGGVAYGDITVSDVADLLDRPRMFSGLHETVWQACLKLNAENAKPTLVTLTETLRTSEQLAKVDVPVWLTQIVHGVASVNLKSGRQHAKLIRDAWVRREMAQRFRRVVAQSYDTTNNLEQLARDAIDHSVHLAEAISVDANWLSAKTVVQSLIADLGQPGASGIATGFRAWDQYTCGLHAKEVTLIAARTSVGKSALATQVAFNVARQGHPVLYVSLEMPAKSFLMRAVASQARVDAQKLRAKIVRNEEWTRLSAASQDIAKIDVHFLDSSSQTLTSILSSARRMAIDLRQRAKRIGLIIIDHIGLVKPSGNAAKRSREQEVAETSRGLRFMSEELDCAVMGLVQINRESEKQHGPDKMPKLHQLRESGALEQDCDNVVLLHRTRMPNGMFVREPASVAIAKQRNGPLGFFKLSCEPEYCAFADMADEFGGPETHWSETD